MKQFDKVAIIGVGLIGGSIGLTIKKERIAREVIGIFRRKATLKKALSRKAVDKGVLDIKRGVSGADLIIVATPVYTIPGMISEAARYAKDGAIITDVGSTKEWIVRKAEESCRKFHVHFVGAHPMAGSEHASVDFAKSGLFKGASCIVTKTKTTNTAALGNIVSFWKSLGARVKVLTPSEHDKRVAFISHLPHIAAFSVAGVINDDDLQYAAEGFRDTTRVASSDPYLWADIFMTNRDKVLSSVRLFERYCKDLAGAIDKKDYKKVVTLLAKAKAKRDKLVRYEK